MIFGAWLAPDLSRFRASPAPLQWLAPLAKHHLLNRIDYSPTRVHLNAHLLVHAENKVTWIFQSPLDIGNLKSKRAAELVRSKSNFGGYRDFMLAAVKLHQAGYLHF